MNVATSPSFSSAHRATATLVVGLCLSLAVHLGVGIGASGYFGSMWASSDSSESAIKIDPDEKTMILPADTLKLGMQDATTASINWLGVIDNPEMGDAPDAPVEQAEFTHQIGNAPATISPQPTAQPTADPIPEIEVPAPQPIVEQEQAEPIEQEPEAIPTEQVELEVEPDEAAPVVIELQPDPVDLPAEEPAEDRDEAQPSPELSIKSQPEQPEQDAQRIEPKNAGKDGIVSPKESAASKIKRAIKVDATKLHRPIVGRGLEITTVEPKFPASVRFTELPQNPVVMIRFNASGRVSKAYFLTEFKRIYDTGVRSVDEPLLSAIYQWRAKGQEIDALDPKDPESFIEISMRITFRKDSKDP